MTTEKETKIPRSEKVRRVAEMFKRGLSYDEAAKELGCSRQLIYNYTADAKRLAFPKQSKPAPKPKAPEPAKRRVGHSDALPIGHSVPTDALWRGLERWRPTTGLHAPGREAVEE